MPGYIFQGNVIIGAQPTLYPPNNAFPVNQIAVRFVDFGGGDYRLLTESPYKGDATDGKDPGADVDAVNAATTGVVR
jgi:hypothetical protein